MGVITKDRRLPFLLRPLRQLYRLGSRLFFRTRSLRQVNIGDLKYLVWSNENIGKQLILLRSFERAEVAVFRRLVRPGDVCIDVGGNIGYYSLNFAKWCGDKGQVHVFEPLHHNALVIELAAELNNIQNIAVVQAALSNTDGVVALSIPSGDGAFAHLTGSGRDVEGMVEVPCMALDSYVTQRALERVDVVKIDVEGAEMLVLQGANAVLGGAHRPRVLMVELVSDYLQRFGWLITDAVQYLGGFGYAPWYAVPGGRLKEYSAEVHDRVFNVFFVTRGC